MRKFAATQPRTHGQYVNDGRGSASMLLDTGSNAVQLSHYYEPYGETLTGGSLAPNTRRAQAGMWDAYGINTALLRLLPHIIQRRPQLRIIRLIDFA
jgi:hypothetical protein